MNKAISLRLAIASAVLCASIASPAQAQDRQLRMRAIDKAMVRSSDLSNLSMRKKTDAGVTFMEWTCKSSTDECLERANNLQANGCTCSSESGGYSCDCPEGDD